MLIGTAVGNHYVQFFECYTKMLNNLAGVKPYCAKVVHIVPPCDKDIIVQHIMHAPMSPLFNLRVTCPWLTTRHLLLDSYHARFRKDLHMAKAYIQWTVDTGKHQVL